MLGAVTYSVSTHSPVPSAQQAAQRTQPHSQAQPESGQHAVCSPEDDCSESSSSSIAASHTASDGGQSLLEAHAATDAGSDAAALQASTAAGADVRTASKRDASAALAHSQEGTEAVSTSLDDDPDADSLIPSSSGILLRKWPCSALFRFADQLLCDAMLQFFIVWFIQLHGHSLPCLPSSGQTLRAIPVVPICTVATQHRRTT